jgi:hypothetical protein
VIKPDASIWKGGSGLESAVHAPAYTPPVTTPATPRGGRPASAAPSSWRSWPAIGLTIALAAGFAARVYAYASVRDTPFLHLHVWTESDMHFYDRWARHIAAGDVLTDQRMRPYQSGHAAVARQAFELKGGSQFDAAAGQRV